MIIKQIMEDNWAQSIAEGVETLEFNKDGNLPFGYFDPTFDGKIYWICSLAKDDKTIISTFFNDNFDRDEPENKVVHVVANFTKAKELRDKLIEQNWQPLKTPTKQFISNGVKIDVTKKVQKRIDKEIKKTLEKNRDFKKELRGKK